MFTTPVTPGHNFDQLSWWCLNAAAIHKSIIVPSMRSTLIVDTSVLPFLCKISLMPASCCHTCNQPTSDHHSWHIQISWINDCHMRHRSHASTCLTLEHELGKSRSFTFDMFPHKLPSNITNITTQRDHDLSILAHSISFSIPQEFETDHEEVFSLTLEKEFGRVKQVRLGIKHPK